MNELSWRDAILRVLREADDPLHYTDIAQQVIDNGYRINVGATPAKTVAAQLGYSNLAPLVQRAARGVYALKQSLPATEPLPHSPFASPPAQAVPPAPKSLPNTPSTPAPTGGMFDANEGAADEGAADEEQMGLINAFGMFWRRDEISWRSGSRLLGVQQSGSTPVDFSAQAGVYLLYDGGNRVVYVGRVTEPRLGRRLWEHTRDRLTSRWDRFSWFGIRPVGEDGQLGDIPESGINMSTLIATMEALLIEGLEPPQNRRQGDGFNALEFIQSTDPEVESSRHRQLLSELAMRLRS